MNGRIDRRRFTAGLGAAVMAAGVQQPAIASPPSYGGSNVIIVRFGGGVRRQETIDPASTYAPFLSHQLVQRGVLIPNMTIAQLDGVETSHAEGTLNLLTGRYLAYRDAGSGVVDDRLEPTEPTLFEMLRKAFDVPSHQALLINGEDRPQEEFFTYGVHKNYGILHRSEMLSLHRYKLYKFSRIIEDPATPENVKAEAQASLDELNGLDRRSFEAEQSAPIENFWSRWRADYGDSGFVNPRGDRLLTTLALRAMALLKPRLMMINYQDTDYVHWGNASHYTRAITVIDQGLEQLVRAAEADPFYRDRTLFVIVPDCGRDANSLVNIPFQHHFNSLSAHEIWAVIFGPGIARGKVFDRATDQSAIAPTVAAVMGFAAGNAEGEALSGIFT